MRRGALSVLGGTLGGLLMTIVILTATRWALILLEPGKVFAIDHGAIYLTLVLGAGVGALSASVLVAGTPSASRAGPQEESVVPRG